MARLKDKLTLVIVTQTICSRRARLRPHRLHVMGELMKKGPRRRRWCVKPEKEADEDYLTGRSAGERNPMLHPPDSLR